MKKRLMVVLTAGLLIIGLFAGFAYAKESTGDKTHKDMVKIMRENGFKDLAKAVEKNDYKAIDKFMNSLTDEDYQKMIDIMRQNGYEDMAKMMESISKDDMIKMHNAMGGAEACHRNNDTSSGMMRSY
ncbi:hypothetical protein [Fonticella tunisiensis]|uniref:Uncharacterized protein n=1 Tax=Fonticella tunisiensis TaxID=1096341 RepID=A0A4R7KVR8_9CLOT|nr:hypothetical protein [Fonticella tunisiensis]TDT63631.1 hypothetical protein EDD71_10156 [Fonticella tunisiensis]